MKCFLFILIIFNLQSIAQNQANIWYFGWNAGIDFNGAVPVSISNGQLQTSEGCASICDGATGELLFYTDGVSVWDSTHTPMLNGTGLMGHLSSSQSAVIVPKPGSTTLYYIFTVDVQGGPFGLRYSIIDMTQNGGLGDILPPVGTNRNQPLITPVTEKLVAVPYNCIDYWVIAHEWLTNAFYAYPVTSAGIGAAVVSNIGQVHIGGMFGVGAALGCMKVSPQVSSSRIACIQ